MPDGSTLFTEPGASMVHKIDKAGTISTFLENTNRANGLALDSKGRLIAVTALTVEVLHPEAAKTVLAKMPTRPNDLVIDKKDGIYFTLPSNKPPVVYYIPAGGQPTIVGEVRSPHGIQLSPDEKTLYVGDSAGAYLVSFDVQPDGKLTNKRNFGKYEGIKAGEGDAGRKPRRRHRGRQRGADLRRHAAGRPDIQQVWSISGNHSHVAAAAEPGVRRPRQEDVVSHRRERSLQGSDAGSGLQGKTEVRRSHCGSGF